MLSSYHFHQHLLKWKFTNEAMLALFSEMAFSIFQISFEMSMVVCWRDLELQFWNLTDSYPGNPTCLSAPSQILKCLFPDILNWKQKWKFSIDIVKVLNTVITPLSGLISNNNYYYKIFNFPFYCNNKHKILKVEICAISVHKVSDQRKIVGILLFLNMPFNLKWMYFKIIPLGVHCKHSTS